MVDADSDESDNPVPILCRDAMSNQDFLGTRTGSQQWNIANSNALKLNGDMLEFATCAAFCLASTSLAGTPLEVFVEKLMFQLCKVPHQLSPRCKHLLQQCSLMVPFFSAVDASWPSFLSNIVVTSCIKRLSDGDRMDIRCESLSVSEPQPIITGECKNYKSAVNIEVISTALAKVSRRGDSNVHIITVSKLQDSYKIPDKSGEQKYLKNLIDGKTVLQLLNETLNNYEVLFLHDNSASPNEATASRLNDRIWTRKTEFSGKLCKQKLVLFLEVGSF